MVSTNDVLLLGGGLLVAFYLSKRSNQVSAFPAIDYYQQVQTVDLQRLTEFGDRISQLKDIRSQILDFEKGKTEQQVSFIESEIQKARAVGSAAQAALAKFVGSPKLGYGPTFITKAYKGETLARALAARAAQAQEQLKLNQSLEFITAAQAQQAELKAKYDELEQIV